MAGTVDDSTIDIVVDIIIIIITAAVTNAISVYGGQRRTLFCCRRPRSYLAEERIHRIQERLWCVSHRCPAPDQSNDCSQSWSKVKAALHSI